MQNKYTEQISGDLGGKKVKLLKSCRCLSRALLKEALNPPQNIGFLLGRKGFFGIPDRENCCEEIGVARSVGSTKKVFFCIYVHQTSLKKQYVFRIAF